MEGQLKAFLEEVDLPASEIHEIDLEAQGLSEITDSDMKFLSQFSNCINLNLGENDIRKISCPFPALSKLAMLDLRENQLGADVLGCLTRLTGVEVLMLTHNVIKTLDKFSALKSLSKLHFLGLEGNPVTETIPDYRQKIFAVLPDLQVIDFVDREGNVLARPGASEAGSDDEGVQGGPNAELAAFYNQEFSDDDEEDDEYEEEHAEEDEDEDEDEDDEDDDDEEEEERPTKKARTGDE